MATAIARRRRGFTHEVEIDDAHILVIDEPRERGGADKGPTPTEALAASLASCIAVTMEMYADHKGWDLMPLEVSVEMDYEGFVPSAFAVTLHLPKALTDEQVERLRVIAGKCPVHRVLSSGAKMTMNAETPRI